LLDKLNIEGKVITADALLTQRKISDYIVKEREADFVLIVKDNQKTLKEDIEALNLMGRQYDFESIDKGHGRIERRRIWCSSLLNNYVEFPNVKQVFCIEREVWHIKKEIMTTEVALGITSQAPEKGSAKKILFQNRRHWSIENKMHYVLDVTFDEDRSRIRSLNGPMVITCLRRFAISFLRLKGESNMAKAFRKYWAKPQLAVRLAIP
jgi:predicted transposase YbfD/YdcC